jgi:hypothetical protein
LQLILKPHIEILIIIKPAGTKGEKIRSLYDFVVYRNGCVDLIVPKRTGENNA